MRAAVAANDNCAPNWRGDMGSSTATTHPAAPKSPHVFKHFPRTKDHHPKVAIVAALMAERDQPVAATKAQTMGTPNTLPQRNERCCLCISRKNSNDTRETWYPLTASK